MRIAGPLLPLILAVALPAAEPPSPPVADAAANPAANDTAKPPTTVATPAKPATAAAAQLPTDTPKKTSPGAADNPAAEGTAKLLPEITQALNDRLPRYIQPAPPKIEATPDPDVLQLPKMTVIQKKRPRLTDAVMMTNKAFNEKLAKEKTSSFDHDFLNKYGWLGGASAADRAREEYDREQRAQLVSDVERMAKAIETTDPDKAKALRDAANKP